MRLAVLSDIHGNLPALEAVISDLKTVSPDIVLHGGDLIASGHRPIEVLDRIRDVGWTGVLGNTDEMLWTPENLGELAKRAPKLDRLLQILFNEFAPATRNLIGEERLRWLRTLPREWRNDGIALVHASPGDLWQAPMPESDPRQLIETYSSLQTAVVVYGHIHRPYIRELPGLVIANSGSVGMPYDGDNRASYLLITDRQVTIRRVEYDVEAEVRELLISGYPHAAWLAEIRRHGKYLPPS